MSKLLKVLAALITGTIAGFSLFAFVSMILFHGGTPGDGAAITGMLVVGIMLGFFGGTVWSVFIVSKQTY